MNKKERKLFSPVRVRRRSTFKNILLGFIAFVAVFAVVAVFYVSKSGVPEKKEEENVSKVIETTKPNFDDRETYKNVTANFLLMSISSSTTIESGEKEIYFMQIAHADAYTGQIKLCPIAAKQSYVDAYNEGGAYAVTKLVAEEYNIKLEKYICSNENTFALAVNYMGGVEYDVPDRLEYRTPDITLILTPGKQTLKGEVLIKYLKYFKSIDISKQNEIIRAFIDGCFTQENFKDPMKVYQGILSSLVGNTNISVYDAADNLKYVRTIVENKRNRVITVSSVEEF